VVNRGDFSVVAKKKGDTKRSRSKHSTLMAEKEDVISRLQREKAEMLEEFTNLALAKAEIEAEKDDIDAAAPLFGTRGKSGRVVSYVAPRTLVSALMTSPLH
jgi:hypothetical protein